MCVTLYDSRNVMKRLRPDRRSDEKIMWLAWKRHEEDGRKGEFRLGSDSKDEAWHERVVDDDCLTVLHLFRIYDKTCDRL